MSTPSPFFQNLLQQVSIGRICEPATCSQHEEAGTLTYLRDVDIREDDT